MENQSEEYSQRFESVKLSSAAHSKVHSAVKSRRSRGN
jgi:hypothetical protein